MRARKSRRPAYRYRMVLGVGGAMVLLTVFFLNRMTIFGVSPDLVTLYALFFIIFGNHRRGGYVTVMLLGLLRDLMSFGVPGTYAILYGLLHKGLAGRKGVSFRESPLALTILGAGSVFAVNIGYYLLEVAQGRGSGMRFGLTQTGLMALVSAPLMPVLVIMITAVLELLRVEKMKEGCFNI